MVLDIPREEYREGGKEPGQYPDGTDRSNQDALYFLLPGQNQGDLCRERRSQVGGRARRACEQAQNLDGGD